MSKYVIWAPPYDTKSGGIKVLHRFCHEMRSNGQEAYVSTRVVNPSWDTPYSENAYDSIVVYPEIVFENPLGGQKLVRYMLNNAGKLSGPLSYEEGTEIFCFSQLFNDFGVSEDRIMFLPVIETDIFYDAKKPRTRKVFYKGKGHKTLFDSDMNADEITKYNADNPHQLAEILQTASLLYCFDNITAMTELARLCGCPVVIVPNGEYTREQYDKHEMGWDGLAWGLEEIDHAIETMDSDKFLQHYLSVKDLFNIRLKRFIEITGD